MSEKVYKRLREFLDKMPGGFPETDSGIEIKILKKIFTPEHAEIATKLGPNPENAAQIAGRLGMSESEAAGKLEDMARRGLIFRERAGKKVLYKPFLFQYIVGIVEAQVDSMDKELAELFEAYTFDLEKARRNIKTEQFRIVPVDSAVEADKVVAPYHRVRDLVRNEEHIAIANCICRKGQALQGNKCDKPRDLCIMFGKMAQYYVDTGRGRQVSTEEALKALDLAEESGLVLSPGNTRELTVICCCCSCCCDILRYLKMTKNPSEWLRLYFTAAIDPEVCTACGECIDRCQIDAIVEKDDVMEIDEDRCIGCGLCVSACPTEAIRLNEREDVEAPPKDFDRLLQRVQIERDVVE